jgi:alginate O-acetyltransferase complex protein AlgI
LSLVAISTVVDYFVGINLEKQTDEKKRKLLLSASILVNIGFLGFFKYYNFFLDNFVALFENIGITLEPSTLKVILPVGISFYTFQTISYSIDVYRRKLKPTKDIITFGAYVSFFPQLVAGPIERAVNLIPQFEKARTFDYELAKDGIKQILWGLFKKVVIADACAVYANYAFENYETLGPGGLAVGAMMFAFQIYGDFSGYSDIAIGTSKLFGFRLMINFKYPYFSRDMAEFWRRWHISLSTWFRDYLYIPLGGSRGGKYVGLRNTFIIFLVSGFWHGANWTFVVWGFLNALYFIPLLLLGKNRDNLGDTANGGLIPSFKEFRGIITTFALTCLAWIFFRADTITHAFDYIAMFFQGNSDPNFTVGLDVIFYLFLAFGIEWIYRTDEHPIKFTNVNKVLRIAIYLFLTFSIVMYFNIENQEFIYFQF